MIILRPFDHYQIRCVFQDYHEYSHIIFSEERDREILNTFLKYYRLNLENKRIHNYKGQQTLRALFLENTDAYVFIPRSSNINLEINHTLIKKSIRHQSCALYDVVC